MDFQQMTKDDNFLQHTTLKPPKNLVVVDHIWNKVCVYKKKIVKRRLDNSLCNLFFICFCHYPQQK